MIKQKNSLNSKDWIYSCGMGIFQIGLGFLLYTKGAQYLQAVELTLLSLTEIIVGPLLVWVIIDESPSVNALIGGAIIFGSILGGSFGNLFDRIYYSAVPDFIDFHINNFLWFVFNVADIFITTGVICLIFVEMFYKNNLSSK